MRCTYVGTAGVTSESEGFGEPEDATPSLGDGDFGAERRVAMLMIVVVVVVMVPDRIDVGCWFSGD